MNELQDIQLEISAERNKTFIGKTVKVLVDKVGESVSVGRTEFDSPDIDNIVQIKGKVNKGEFYNVSIDRANEYELIGSVI